MLEGMTANQDLLLELYRGGDFREITATAEELPQSMVRNIASRLLGLGLELSDAHSTFAISRVDAGSAAEAIGLRPGDLLLGINGVALASQEDLRRAVARLRGRARALVVVQRGRGRYHLTLPLY